MTEMPKTGRIITLEHLHQHVLDLAADLRIEWTDRFVKADPEIRTLCLHPISQKRAMPPLCVRLATSAQADLTMR